MSNILEKTLKVIEKTREKPEHVRHLVSLSVAGGFTLVLFLMWAFILLPMRFDSPVLAEKSKEISPFASLKAQVGSAYDDFLKTLKNQDGTNENSKSLWQNSYEKIKSEAQNAGQ